MASAAGKWRIMLMMHRTGAEAGIFDQGSEILRSSEAAWVDMDWHSPVLLA